MAHSVRFRLDEVGRGAENRGHRMVLRAGRLTRTARADDDVTDDPSYGVGTRRVGAETRRVKLRPPAVLRRATRFGISRHGVIANARRLRQTPLPPVAGSLVWVLSASALIGLGVAFLLAAELGVPPFDVWLSAVDQRTPLSHGQAAWATSGVIFAVAAAMGVRPKLAGLVFVFVNGLSVDIAQQLIVTPDTLGVRVMMAVVGLFLLASGIGLIVHAAATGGAFEAVMEVADRRGADSSRVRTLLELTVLGAGILAGGEFGLLTVVVALTLGPLLAAVMQALADHRAGREARLDATRATTY